MPGKDKRVAARQTQLRQKKRKSERLPVRGLAPSTTPTAEPVALDTAVEQQPRSNRPAAPLIDSSTQLSQIRPYVTKELRRISLLSALMVVALASIGVLLQV